jgi:penicillin-binding protein activator
MRPATLRQALAAIATLAALSGCGTAVQRIEPGEIRDLSGMWNDTDSRLVAEEMARDLRAWVEAYRLANQRSPTLVVGEVRNLAQETIGVASFIGDIERALAETRRVTFVASGEERAGARAERKEQDFHAAGATRKPMGHERGADYLLTGTISAIVDRDDWSQVRYYQVDLALIDLGDNTKVWLGQKKIKKSVRRPPISDSAVTAPPYDTGARFASQGSIGPTGKSSRIPNIECGRKPYPPAYCF